VARVVPTTVGTSLVLYCWPSHCTCCFGFMGQTYGLLYVVVIPEWLTCRMRDLKIGELVGTDSTGNKYYQNNNYFFGETVYTAVYIHECWYFYGSSGRNRWVFYAKKRGEYDASDVPAEWYDILLAMHCIFCHFAVNWYMTWLVFLNWSHCI